MMQQSVVKMPHSQQAQNLRAIFKAISLAFWNSAHQQYINFHAIVFRIKYNVHFFNSFQVWCCHHWFLKPIISQPTSSLNWFVSETLISSKFEKLNWELQNNFNCFNFPFFFSKQNTQWPCFQVVVKKTLKILIPKLR